MYIRVPYQIYTRYYHLNQFISSLLLFSPLLYRQCVGPEYINNSVLLFYFILFFGQSPREKLRYEIWLPDIGLGIYPINWMHKQILKIIYINCIEILYQTLMKNQTVMDTWWYFFSFFLFFNPNHYRFIFNLVLFFSNLQLIIYAKVIKENKEITTSG